MAEKGNDKKKKFEKTEKEEYGWLQDMQKKHVNRVEKAVETLQDNIINAIKGLDTNKDGTLKGVGINLKNAQQIHEDIEKIYENDWKEETLKITDEYSEYRNILKRSYAQLDESIKFTGIDNDMMDVLKDNSWQRFVEIGETSKDRIVQAVYNDVIGGASFSDLVGEIRGALLGYRTSTGRPMVQYARLYARDMIMDFSRQVHTKKSEDIGINTFLYVGDIIKTSRRFCINRVTKSYTKEQIQSWNYKWAGKSGPAFTNCGGWNCRHHWRGIRVEWGFEDTVDKRTAKDFEKIDSVKK